MYITRYLESTVLETHRSFKIVYLGGPRQVGKTTLLRHLAKKIKMGYVSLDDLNLRRLAKEDPELFLQRYPAPLMIDEVQHAPELFPYLKLNVDNSPKKGQYWLTGSQHFALMKNVKESLAGRVGVLHLLGLSLAEKRGIKNTGKARKPVLSADAIFRHIFLGGFPAMHEKKTPVPETFFNSYLQTYIDRDLREIFHIGKISAFHTFLQLCAARTGQMLNYSDLARDAGISVNAAREWIGVLEAGMLIYLLKPYHGNFSKQLIKSPKMYFLDTGLAAFLTKWKTQETLASGAMAGAFFETFAISEIIKSFLFRGQEPPLYYFRDKKGHEIDLLTEKDGVLYPIEIKMSAKADKNDLKNIHYLKGQKLSLGRGSVICLASKPFPIDRENKAIPISFIG